MTPTIWLLRKRQNYRDNKNISVCQGLWGRKEGQKGETQRIFREQREKKQLTIYVEVCLWTPFCSTDLCVYPSINTVLCIVYGIGDIYSRPKNHDTSSFILFLSFYCCTCSIWKFPGLGIKSEQQLQACATATAMLVPSFICNLHHSWRQCKILNPLSEARDQTRILKDMMSGS